MKVALAAAIATSVMMTALSFKDVKKATMGFFQKAFTLTTQVVDLALTTGRAVGASASVLVGEI